MSDASKAEFYKDPANLRAGKRLPVERPNAPLSHHVPIRFTSQVIEQVKRFAAEDGLSVSSWIRRVVTAEIDHRARPVTGGLALPADGWVNSPPPPGSVTVGHQAHELVSAL